MARVCTAEPAHPSASAASSRIEMPGRTGYGGDGVCLQNLHPLPSSTACKARGWPLDARQNYSQHPVGDASPRWHAWCAEPAPSYSAAGSRIQYDAPNCDVKRVQVSARPLPQLLQNGLCPWTLRYIVTVGERR
jgi:hypothetical protein